MRGAITDVIAARAKDEGGLGRKFAYSLVTHIVVGIAFILLSSNFLSGKQAKTNVIEVSLAGSMGAKTSGVAPIAAKRVDQAQPEQKRPAPVLPAPPPKPDTMPAPTKAVTPPKTPEKVPEKAATPTPAPSKPAVGAQVQPGTAVVETGATGLGQGLTQAGGGGTGGVVDLNTFDPVWTRAMQDAIRKQWNNLQPETGWVEILFILNREGKVISREPVASSGSFLLNQEAQRAIGLAIIPPLPREHKEPTLRVRLRFNYGIK
jgi:outer membrane biosynthesis protein TonB